MAQDIFRLLEKDHREVKSLMDKVASGGNSIERKNIFQKVKDENGESVYLPGRVVL